MAVSRNLSIPRRLLFILHLFPQQGSFLCRNSTFTNAKYGPKSRFNNQPSNKGSHQRRLVCIPIPQGKKASLQSQIRRPLLTEMSLLSCFFLNLPVFTWTVLFALSDSREDKSPQAGTLESMEEDNHFPASPPTWNKVGKLSCFYWTYATALHSCQKIGDLTPFSNLVV